MGNHNLDDKLGKQVHVLGDRNKCPHKDSKT